MMAGLRIVTLLTVLLKAVGCGGSGGPGTASGLGTPPPAGAGVAPPVGRIVIDSTLQPRVVPNTVTAFRFIGRDATGRVIFGPVVALKAARLVLDNVPVSVTQLSIEYLQNDEVVGLVSVAVQIQSGGTFTITDPEFVDVGRAVTRIDVTPSPVRLAKGTSQGFQAVARLADGDTLDVTLSVAWSTTDGAIAAVDASGATGQQQHSQVRGAVLDVAHKPLAWDEVVLVDREDDEVETRAVDPGCGLIERSRAGFDVDSMAVCESHPYSLGEHHLGVNQQSADGLPRRRTRGDESHVIEPHPIER